MFHRRRLSATLRSGAVLLPLAAILVVVWPNIAGRAGLGPETIFDLTEFSESDRSTAILV